MNKPRKTLLNAAWLNQSLLGSLIVSAAFVLGSMGAQAQESQEFSASKLQIPDGPLLNPIPAFAEWVVTYSYPEDRASSGSATPPNDLRPRKITTTKTKTVLHEETVDTRGIKTSVWQLNGVVYGKDDNTQVWSQSSPGTSGYAPIQADRFRDLGVVTRENYAGTIKYSGRDCLVFVPGGATSLNLSNPDIAGQAVGSLKTVAFIDVESRLPVEVRESGVIRYFQFGDAPSDLLTPPPDLAQAIQQGAEATARLSAPAGRPF